MNKIIRFSLLSVILFSVALVSCTKTDTNPSPSGDDRAKFIGNWAVHEIHNKADYSVTISADPNESSRVLIDNFGNLLAGNKATAYISGSTIVLDANQTVGNMTVIGGNGSMTGTTKITWTYSMTDGATRTDATATYTKK